MTTTLLTVHMRLEGIKPLLMHAEAGVNPFDPLTRQIKALTGKRLKTDEDQLAIARLEWELGMYYIPDIGPYIPGANVKKCVMEAAAINRGATAVKRALIPMDAEIPLLYEGPRTLEALWEGGYAHTCSVGIGKKKIMRCRPRFNRWHLETSMRVNTAALDYDALMMYLRLAGDLTGLGDYRPTFGRFVAEMAIVDEVEFCDAGASEEEDAQEEMAHA